MVLSIRQKIIFYTAVPVALIFTTIFSLSLFRNINSEIWYMEAHLANMVTASAKQFKRSLGAVKLVSRGMASQVELMTSRNNQQRKLVIEALLRSVEFVEGIGLIYDKEGQPLQVSIFKTETDHWETFAIEDHPDLASWARKFLSSGETENWSPQMSVIFDSDPEQPETWMGYLHGVRLQVDPSSSVIVFAYLAAEDIPSGPPIYGIQPHMVLVNPLGQRIPVGRNLSSDEDTFYTPDVLEQLSSAVKEIEPTKAPVIRISVDEIDTILAMKSVGEAGWTMIGAIPEDDICHFICTEVLVQTANLLLSLALIFVSLWFGTGLILRPLHLLERAMSKVAEGDLDVRVKFNGNDEVSYLADRFSDMTSKLQWRGRQEWETRTASFEHIVQTLGGDYFYFTHDASGSITYVSPSVLRVLGISAEDFRTYYSTPQPDQPAAKRDADTWRLGSGVLSGSNSGIYEVELHDGQGKVHHLEVVKVPVFDCVGQFVGAEAMARDITRRTSDVVRFRGLLESAPDAMVITDVNGCITMVNAQAETLLGYWRYNLIGKSVSMLFASEDWERFPFLDMSPTMRTEFYIRTGMELRVVTFKNKTIPVEITLSPIETPDGVLISIFMRDINDRRIAERALRTSEERFRRMVEALQEEHIFYTQKVDGTFIFVTESVQKILGYTPSQFMEGILTRLHRQQDKDLVNDVFKKVISGQKCSSFEVEMIKADGSVGVLEVFDSPAFDENGEVTVIEGLLRDRTRERAAAVALAEACDAAETANEAKTQFLSHMSHELRTPLNGVLGYSQLLLAGREVNPEQYNQLVGIQTCGKHLLTLINDILDLTKAESGNMEIVNNPFNLPVLGKTVEQMLCQKVEQKGLSLKLIINPEVPVSVMGDETKIRQILINLVSNAIQYTEAGWIQLTVSVREGQLCFSVEDSGIGISKEQIEYIFTPFRQVRGEHHKGGTGLGLAISRRIASEMGGALEVFSEFGIGSSFLFTMPLLAAGDQDYSEPFQMQYIRERRLDSGQNVRVMVVDDSEVNSHVLLQMLGQAGFRVITVDSGRKAVEIISKEPCDLVLMDLRMPGMSGFRAARMIQRHSCKPGLPIIAISASPYPSFRKNMRRWGFADFISKPYRSQELFRVICRHLNLRWQENRHMRVLTEVDGKLSISPVLAMALINALADAVDLGDVEDVRHIVAEFLEQNSTHNASVEYWVKEIHACCETLDFETLKKILEQLEGHVVATVEDAVA